MLTMVAAALAFSGAAPEPSGFDFQARPGFSIAASGERTASGDLRVRGRICRTSAMGLENGQSVEIDLTDASGRVLEAHQAFFSRSVAGLQGGCGFFGENFAYQSNGAFRIRVIQNDWAGHR